MARVLIVDDEPSILETFAAFLGKEGYETREASGVAAARAALAEGDIDVVLADIIMPDGSGVDLLRELGERGRGEKVILVTGQPDLETASDAVRLGAFDYLAKPVRRHDLLRAVERAVRLKRLEDENRRYREDLESLVEERTRDLRESEAKYRANEARYRALTENQQDVVLSLGPGGEVRYCSPAIREYGYEPEATLGTNIAAYIARGEDARRSLDGIAQMARDLRPDTIEIDLRTAAGENIPVEISATPIEQYGALTSVQCIMRDLRERRQEEDLRRATLKRVKRQKAALAELATHEAADRGEVEEFAQSLTAVAREALEVERVCVWRMSGEGDLLRCVDPTTERAGDIPPVLPLHHAYLEPLQDVGAIAVEDTEADETLAPLRDRFGLRSFLLGRVAAQGRTLGIIAAWNSEEARGWREDELSFLTAVGDQFALAMLNAERQEAEREKAQLEEQLLQSQRLEAIGRLAGGVAHDFNNALTIINGNAEIVLDSVSKDDPLYMDVEEIRKAAERAGWLTAQLLAFSRRQVIDPRPVDLSEEVRRSEKMLRRIIGEDIRLVCEPDADLWLTHMDPRQVDQILVNLATNSRDAMPRGGRLSIRVGNVAVAETKATRELPAGRYVRLTVSDDGAGMSAATREHVFEPFFTTKETGKGTGLGLATVYGIVRQNKGFLQLHSTLGEGTTFHIYFPELEDEDEDNRPDLGDTPLPGGPERILVVEDEEMVRRLTRRILERVGYTVTEARDGLEARVLFNAATEPFDLLVTDVVMPKMNGRELHDALRAERSDLRALFVSGHSDDIIAQHGILEPGVRFLNKPYTAEKLTRAVREVLDE